MKILILLFAGITIFAIHPAFCQTNYMATNQMVFPRHLGGGNGFPPIRTLTNSYPYIRIGGDGEDEEFQYFMRDISKNTTIIETLPSEQDTNGNWGMPTDGMQLSVRFHQQQFTSGLMVPAYIILRNLGTTNRTWVRNALPDNGYKFILTNGTNILTWRRPQSVPPPHTYMIDTGSEEDPYTYIAETHTQGLTIELVS